MVNQAPVVQDLSVTAMEDTRLSITPSATDAEGDSLSFTVASAPAHGRASLLGSIVYYYPTPNYHGPDSFTLTASDGQATSAPATVSITVTPVNDAPVIDSPLVRMDEDTAAQITLTAVDVEGDPVTFSVMSAPSHGTLSGTPPVLTYTPDPDYYGSDRFAVKASDGMAAEARGVSIVITPVNDAPVAQAQTLTVPMGSPASLALYGTDMEGDELTYSILSSPETGTITGALPDVLYTPPPGFQGTTRLTFAVSDGQLSSSAEVQLTVEERSLTVSAAVDTLRPVKGMQVRFYANAVDEGGAPISLQWDFGDGSTSQEELPVHAFADPGTYEVRLKASTATEEASTLLRMRVNRGYLDVRPSNGGPPLVGGEGSEMTVTASVGYPNSLSWNLGDGSSAMTDRGRPYFSHTWRDDGVYTLAVHTSVIPLPPWPSFDATRTLIIYNTPPVPLPQERVSATVGEMISVQLSGEDASSEDYPLQWELVSGEGEVTRDGLFTWTPSRAGLATIITKVLDGDGGEARLAFQVDVAEDPAPPRCGCGASSGGASGGLALGLLLLSLAASARRSRPSPDRIRSGP